MSNQYSVFRSRDLYWPITGLYSGYVTSLDQSQASIQVTWPVLTSTYVTWPVLTNDRPPFRSLDQYWPITGQYSHLGLSMMSARSQMTRIPYWHPQMILSPCTVEHSTWNNSQVHHCFLKVLKVKEGQTLEAIQVMSSAHDLFYCTCTELLTQL